MLFVSKHIETWTIKTLKIENWKKIHKERKGH